MTDEIEYDIANASIRRRELIKDPIDWNWMVRELENGNIRITYYGDTMNGEITPKKIRIRLLDELEELAVSG